VAAQNETDSTGDRQALAGLVRASRPGERPSVVPRAPSTPPVVASSDDDGKLDLRALASSSRRSSSEVPPDQIRAALTMGTPSSEIVRAAPLLSPANPVVATEPLAQARPARSNGMWIGVVIGIAVAGTVAFAFSGQFGADDATESTSVADATGTIGSATGGAPQAVRPPAELPVVVAAAPTESEGEPTRLDPEATTTAPLAAVAVLRAEVPRPASAPAVPPSAPARAAVAEPEPPVRPPTEPTTRPAVRATPEPGRDPSALDSVLDTALGARAQTPSAPTAPVAADLPDTPGRADVARALGQLLPGIRQCAGEQVGLATATILVRNDGTVASASVGGNPFGGTPQGSCMEGVVRRAHFPRFRQSTHRVVYPFSIR